MIKKIILALAVALPACFAANAQTLKIGIVDTAAIVQVLPDTQKAEQQVQEAQNKYGETYKALVLEYNRMGEELQKLDEKEGQATRDMKARDLQNQQQKIQQFENDVQNDLMKLQQSLLQPIYQKVKDAVESVAKEGNFTLVQSYDPQLTLYYAAPVEDITPLVKAKLGVK